MSVVDPATTLRQNTLPAALTPTILLLSFPPRMYARLQPTPFAAPTACVAQSSVDACLDAIGCTKRPTKPLLAWRFFLRLYLRLITKNEGERLLPGTATVQKLMESIAAREIPPACGKPRTLDRA